VAPDTWAYKRTDVSKRRTNAKNVKKITPSFFESLLWAVTCLLSFLSHRSVRPCNQGGSGSRRDRGYQML
jgi:hypothetical protein